MKKFELRAVIAPSVSGDTTPCPGAHSGRGLAQAHGIMVNYLYDLKYIERNHEAYVNDGVVAASRAVRPLARGTQKAAKKTKTEKEVAVPADE